MLVGVALAVVLIAAVVVVLLIVRRRRRVRAEKLAFISDLHAVEADRVIHSVVFPLWTGPLSAIGLQSEADADTYMGGPLAETDFGSNPEPAAMTMTIRPRHSLEGEVDVDAPIVSKAARSAAHTTVVDSRLGLSEEALTELENPLYVSERADGDWSQSFAFVGLPSRNFQAMQTGLNARRRAEELQRLEELRRRELAKQREEEEARRLAEEKRLREAEEEEKRKKKSVKSFLDNFRTVARRSVTKKPVLFTREVLRTTPAESGEFMAVSRGEVLSVMQELPDGTVVVRRAGSDEKALVRVEVFEP